MSADRTHIPLEAPSRPHAGAGAARQHFFPGQAHGAPPALHDNQPIPEEIAFLEGRHLDGATLRRAAILARQWRISPEQVLFKTGWLGQSAYYSALAAFAGLGFTRLERGALDRDAMAAGAGMAPGETNIVPLRGQGGTRRLALAPSGRGLRQLLAMIRRPEAVRELRGKLVLTTPRDVTRAVQDGFRRNLCDFAINGLRAGAPHLSAAGGLTAGQSIIAGLFLVLSIAGMIMAWQFTAAVWNLLLAALFFLLGVLRAVAGVHALYRAPARPRPLTRLGDDDLPVYTLLVPLYREPDVVRRLALALARIDYPALCIKSTTQRGHSNGLLHEFVH